MATQGQQLDTGAAFPALSWKLTDGKTLDLPVGLGQGWSVVLIMRGQW